MINIISVIKEFIIPVFNLIKNPIRKKIEAYQNKKKNIIITITGYEARNSFSIDLRSTTPLDFKVWRGKFKSGGEVVVKFNCIDEMERKIKKSKDESEIKNLDYIIERFEKSGKVIEVIIKKVLLDKKLLYKVDSFPNFIQSTVMKCLPFDMSNEKNKTEGFAILEVYNDFNKSFKFRISRTEYDNVCGKSNGAIKGYKLMYFYEFMNLVLDKSIFEREIIPVYLKRIVNQEILKGKEFPIDDFYYWWISDG